MTHAIVIISLSLVSILAAIALWRVVRKSPEGWEDANGFHYGRRPVSAAAPDKAPTLTHPHA